MQNKDKKIIEVRSGGLVVSIDHDRILADARTDFKKPFQIQNYAKTKVVVKNGVIVEGDVDHIKLMADYDMQKYMNKDKQVFFDVFCNYCFQVGLCVKYARGGSALKRRYKDATLMGLCAKFFEDVSEVAGEKNMKFSNTALSIIQIVVDKGWQSLFGNVWNAAKFIQFKGSSPKKTIR